MAQMSHPVVGRRHALWMTNTFYLVIVAIAGIGNVTATWLPWDVKFKIPAVAALELGGVVLAANADVRRRLGERAYAWRTSSAAVAGIAIGINWFGHTTEPIQAVFFTGFSAVGYGIYLIRSGDARRDHLRITGSLPPTTPAYGLVRWLTHPRLTLRARDLARRTPAMSLYESLDAAVTERDEKVRDAEAARQREADDAALLEALSEVLMSDVPESYRPVALRAHDLPTIVATIRGEIDNAAVGRRVAQTLMVGRAVAMKRAPAGDDGEAPPRRRVARTVPAPAPARGRSVREPVDPFVRYADQISAVQSAIPDWKTRRERIKCREVKACAGVGGREPQLRIRALLEALSDRGPVDVDAQVGST